AASMELLRHAKHRRGPAGHNRLHLNWRPSIYLSLTTLRGGDHTSIHARHAGDIITQADRRSYRQFTWSNSAIVREQRTTLARDCRLTQVFRPVHANRIVAGAASAGSPTGSLDPTANAAVALSERVETLVRRQIHELHARGRRVEETPTVAPIAVIRQNPASS